MIVGIDEVGRGAWAGPMVVGAVLLGGATIKGLTDSKKLSKKQRELLDREIRCEALAIGLGWVSAKQIDTIGLSAALKLAAQKALAHIRRDYSEIIIDGTIALVDDPRVTLMKKADLLIPSVSAASIVAKVARDNYMKHLDGVFPGYKFGAHVGYGTAAHLAAIKANGATPIHRLSFAPLKPYALQSPSFDEKEASKHRISTITTKKIGDAGEDAAVVYLKHNNHEIIARNWRTKYCEIDIVSRRGDTIYFTEVKYRKNTLQGGGLAAITAKKQQQMAFAAEFYATKHMVDDNLRLAVITVAGQLPAVQAYLELG